MHHLHYLILNENFMKEVNEMPLLSEWYGITMESLTAEDFAKIAMKPFEETKIGGKNEKWEFYKIGGRWELILRCGHLDDLDRFKTNWLFKKDLNMEYTLIPYSYSLNFKWIEKPNDKEERKEWDKEFIDVLYNLKENTMIIVIDYHI